ncbi:4'-phosphopantetheinyl transferase family protein [Paracoccus benzoatiresistens]|uniref:Enterobactin synthase component D n=1 Tax=Paracoccus benzoatiresistens TaxID=2997341 RepID=A0ABT4JB46_9RHOB|nr:4'-phosphopantetheinyl transferase superfamily protein [Paracoccus sp. EF6]MCZ0964303.1 4'-phosphopantetheinyl transferase superfamily protein [Paracoccus sp. EF6]
MDRTPAEQLAHAMRDLPLPPGGALAFVPVRTFPGASLPEAIRRWSPRRQASFAAGRLAAKDALCRAAGRDIEPPGIDSDRLPAWPDGWVGSISHTDGIAAALVAPRRAARLLGLDVERIMTDGVASDIAPEVVPELSPGSSGLPLHVEVTRAFSAKEALYKALYPLTRQFRDFGAARVDWQKGEPDEQESVRLVLTEDWSAEWPAGTVFEAVQKIAAGHVATILWR